MPCWVPGGLRDFTVVHRGSLWALGGSLGAVRGSLGALGGSYGIKGVPAGAWLVTELNHSAKGRRKAGKGGFISQTYIPINTTLT